GGDITIFTSTLEVFNGARLQASTLGEGNAGSIFIEAGDSATFSGTSEDGQLRSVAASTVEGDAVGDGGDIT
ncbi:hypothetical protein, partial [Leptolyngbya sp. CCY15150]|uniref:hypothetical protein n=1 Tax=Leptolyngbya sp. CCY15150 TaxID=2767772 RepID=UPI00194EFCA6